MNPAILNYLQSQQQNQMQGNEGAPQQGAPYNPFDTGIRKAIESARESLGMTEKQQDKALRRSMLTFADNIALQPKQKGFFNNFGSAARALSPAIGAYDDAEDMSLEENKVLGNQILAYKAAEEAKQAHAEEQAWRHQHADAQLGEQKRYHDMMNSYQRQKLQGIGGNSLQSGPEFTPITNKAEVTAYAKDKKALGAVMKEVTDLEENYKKFREDYQGNIINDPMSAISGAVNPTKDFFAKFSTNKKLRQESADRKTLNSRLNKFVSTSERALKGGGVLGPKIIEIFKEQGIYPSLENDTPETFESKLKMIKDEIQNGYKTANLSLQYGVRLDPSNVGEFQNYLTPKQKTVNDIQQPITDSMETSEQYVAVQNPETGETADIMIEDLPEALNRGWIQVQ